ncbi:MAG TPA: zinc ribbon domain-containing protein [Anaerolineaceae bacterium]|nr:zinc ribbon domain-containing protein [Anaerolineaceae bacterium]
MRKWIFALGFVALALFMPGKAALAQTAYPPPASPPPAQTTGGITLSNLEIDLWPEYDRPSVLVIYHLVMAQGAQLPASLALHIPAESGDPYNVAYRDTDGLLYNIAYTRSIEGPWATIHFTAPTNEIQFEYYDPGLKKNGANRSYSYQWPGDYAITSLAIQVQQPVSASNMQITPALGSPLTGDSNLLYYKSVVGSAAQGETFAVSFSYQKSNDDLSAQSLKVQPATPINDQTPGRTTINQIYPWLIGAVGVLLITGGWWYWQSGQTLRPRASGRKRHDPAQEAGRDPDTDDADVYCHQCGKRAAPGDIYCRACGARLRRGE